MGATFLYDNKADDSDVTLAVSSVASGYAASWILDPQRTRRWRSAAGWTVVEGWNDDIDFTEGSTGAAVATLTAGTYATGALMAAEMQTQINAAATDNTYTVTYDTASGFTIARATGSDTIAFPWSTGTNAATSFGTDAGFDADDSGSTSYSSDTVTYQSRHRIRFTLSADVTPTYVALVGHNGGTTASIHTMASYTDSTFASVTTAATTLAGTGDIRAVAFSGTELAYELVINDRTNTDGYAEVGWVYIGDDLQPALNFSFGDQRPRMELSGIGMSDHGAIFVDEKDTSKGHRLTFQALRESEASSLRTMADAVKVGLPLLFATSTSDLAGLMQYGYFSTPWAEQGEAGEYFTLSSMFQEIIL